MTAPALVERGEIDQSALKRVRETLKRPGAMGEVRKFHIDELVVDPGYQRAISGRRVATMIAQFDPRLLGVIVVGLRGGKSHLIDGQHRWELAKAVGIKTLNGIGIETSSQREEAYLYVAINTERRRLLSQQLFAALIVAGDKMAIDIDEMVKRYRFRFQDPDRFVTAVEKNTINAIGSLQKIYERGGRELLDDVLKVLRHSWGGEPVSLSAIMIRGMARFMARNEEPAMDIAKALKEHDPYQLIEDASRIAHRKHLPKMEALAIELEKAAFG